MQMNSRPPVRARLYMFVLSKRRFSIYWWATDYNRIQDPAQTSPHDHGRFNLLLNTANAPFLVLDWLHNQVLPCPGNRKTIADPACGSRGRTIGHNSTVYPSGALHMIPQTRWYTTPTMITSCCQLDSAFSWLHYQASLHVKSLRSSKATTSPPAPKRSSDWLTQAIHSHVCMAPDREL